VQVIGHRGAAALVPENTWVGFDRALDLGVDAIETDVQATSDGVLVLIHDMSLDRTTDGQGPVSETPWSVIGRLDAGSWFDPQYRGARVPLLDETLERYGKLTHIALAVCRREKLLYTGMFFPKCPYTVGGSVQNFTTRCKMPKISSHRTQIGTFCQSNLSPTSC
jgi:hypothetical protein